MNTDQGTSNSERNAITMKQDKRFFLLAAVLLLGLSGCVSERSDGPATTFTYALWVPLSLLLIGIVAAPIGWFLRQSSSRFGWGLLIVGPVAALFFAPSLLLERSVVDDTKFSMRSGIWGMTAVHEVKFEDLKRVRIISEERRGRRGSKRTSYYVLCERQDGSSAKVPANNDVQESASVCFLEQVSARGIPVVDEVGR